MFVIGFCTMGVVFVPRDNELNCTTQQISAENNQSMKVVKRRGPLEVATSTHWQKACVSRLCNLLDSHRWRRFLDSIRLRPVDCLWCWC